MLDVIIKNNDGTNQQWETDVASIDDYLPERYTRKQLEDLLADEV